MAYLATREVAWRVMSVERAMPTEDTFCAVVPQHEFTLAGGIYTHNWERASRSAGRGDLPGRCAPRQMGAVREDHYAFPDPDVINKLVDEYATEHNVRPPLE